MKSEIIITQFSNATSEGVVLNLRNPTSLKTGNIKSKEFWVSWDKIGSLLFDNYTDKIEVDERNNIRSGH